MEARPGVAAIVFDRFGNVLLHWRRIGEAWAPPSGSVEVGETVRSALRREMREETNLEIAVNGLVGVYSAPETQIINYPNGTKIHFVTCVFRCDACEGQLKGSGEGVLWDWFAPCSLPEPILPYAERWLTDAFAVRKTPVID